MNDEKTVDKIIFITIPLVSLKQTRKQEKQAQKKGDETFFPLRKLYYFLLFFKTKFFENVIFITFYVFFNIMYK